MSQALWPCPYASNSYNDISGYIATKLGSLYLQGPELNKELIDGEFEPAFKAGSGRQFSKSASRKAGWPSLPGYCIITSLRQA